ncbi:MAG: 4Fe-4S binding protein [Betaproteobacteria bacterium]
MQDKRARGGRYDWIKYGIWVPWLSGIIALAVSAGGFQRVDLLYQTAHGLSVTKPLSYIIFYSFVALIVLLALTAGRRAFCHYVCWMAPFMIIGTSLRRVFRWPSLHLAADPQRCTECDLCTRNCPMSLDVKAMVRRGAMENPECILCGKCVDGCPKGVVKYSFGGGRPAATSAPPPLDFSN